MHQSCGRDPASTEGAHVTHAARQHQYHVQNTFTIEAPSVPRRGVFRVVLKTLCSSGTETLLVNFVKLELRSRRGSSERAVSLLLYMRPEYHMQTSDKGCIKQVRDPNRDGSVCFSPPSSVLTLSTTAGALTSFLCVMISPRLGPSTDRAFFELLRCANPSMNQSMNQRLNPSAFY